MPRYFTLAEAREYLPEVGRSIREAVDSKKVLEAAEKEHRAMVKRIMLSGGAKVDPETAVMARAKREATAATLKRIFENLEQIGCLIKDLDIGLVDFPALHRGKEVYLCWRLGEPDIAFWHPVDAGFAGRREIDGEFIRECGWDR